MQKRRLAVEELGVESFDTSPVPRMRGTVAGHYFTAVNCATDEYVSCAGSCDVDKCFPVATGASGCYPYTCGEPTCVSGVQTCGESSCDPPGCSGPGTPC